MFRKKLRMFRWMGVALAAAAIAAPVAQAQVATGGGEGISAQVATAGGNGVSGQVATGGGNGVSAQPAPQDDGFSWSSALVAGSALAALGAAGAALSRRPRREGATLAI